MSQVGTVCDGEKRIVNFERWRAEIGFFVEDRLSKSKPGRQSVWKAWRMCDVRICGRKYNMDLRRRVAFFF